MNTDVRKEWMKQKNGRNNKEEGMYRICYFVYLIIS